MRIAITGATGLVGRYLVERFVERGDQVIVLGREKAKLAMFGDEVIKCESDYSRDSLKAAFKNVAAIVHLAARRVAPFSEGMAPFWEANVRTTENVLLAAADCEVGQVCQASSLSVYSSANKVPCTLDEAPVPLSFYGISKLACEHLATVYARQFPLRVASLRISGVIGYGDQTGEGFMFARFVQLARQKQTLQIWGEGVGARDMIYVRDVVSAIEKTVAHLATGVFNVGMGRAVSVRELAETINEVFGNQGNLIFDTSKPEDKRYIYMDSSRAMTELDWHPQWSLGEALEEMKRFYAQQGA